MFNSNYDELYHYTTWDGLLNILKTQTLWATHFQYLNDYTEVKLFKRKLVEYLYPYVFESYSNLLKTKPNSIDVINKKGGVFEVSKHDTQVFVDGMYDALGRDIYILSFSGPPEKQRMKNDGILSQWRSYGVGGGAAIVFDSAKVHENLETESQNFEYGALNISDVIYSDDAEKFTQELSEKLEVLGSMTSQLFDLQNLQSRNGNDLSNGYRPFVNCITRYKHYGFSEENEVRVVAIPVLIDKEAVGYAESNGIELRPEKEIFSRDKNGQTTPFIKLFDSSNMQLPIKRIIVGPHKDKENRESKLKVLLKDSDIQVVSSTIPFSE